ncbi:helix-turn-helix transcriptional regulator [bacterium]|nr:helix-turn-helix transcriptional regulator [bacterium]
MIKDFKKSFGSRVKYFRNLLDYSQEELAEKIGVSSNTISYIERGKNAISFAKLPTLCTALEIEPYKLFINTTPNTDNEKIEYINNLLKFANKKQLNIIGNLVKDIIDN